MKRHTFAGRLSRKIAFITSLVFVIALAVMNVQSIRISKKNSVTYATELLKHAMKDIESSILMSETMTKSIAISIEEFSQARAAIDTANFFDLLERSVSDNPNILGLGIFYEPYAFTNASKYCGLYVNRNDESGTFVHEYDDDESFAEDGWDYFDSEWYSKAKETGESQWVPPFLEYMETMDSLLVTSYAVPIKDSDGTLLGVCAVDLSLDWIEDQLNMLKPYPRSNIVVADYNLNFICNPMSPTPFSGSMYDTPFVPGMDWTVTPGEESTLQTMMTEKGSITIKGNRNVAFCVFGQIENGWVLAANSLYDDAFHDINVLLGILFLLTVAGIIILYYSSRGIIRKAAHPIVEFADAASKITDGHFDIPIPEVDTDDEMTDLGNALRYMQKSVSEYIERLKVTTTEKERLESELNVARTIQAQMLKTDFPDLGKGGIYASSTPAREVGGDLYDFFVSGDILYFILGDVSGKGVPAALLMAITISAFRASGKKGRTSSEIVSLINSTFCSSNQDMTFVTLVAGKIDMKTGEMEYCNAGHNPMVLIGPDGKAAFMKESTNVACGVEESFQYASDEVALKSGSRLVIYSDGITEAEDKSKKQYGEDRLLKWASELDRKATDKEAVESLSKSVHGFAGRAVQNDDMTIMTISI